MQFDTSLLTPRSEQLVAQYGDRVPNLAEYFGYWAIHEPVIRAAVERFQKLDLRLHVHEHAGDPALALQARRGFDVVPGASGGSEQRDQIALIEASGVLMKHTSSMSDGTSTVAMRRAVRLAGNDDAIAAVLLHIDSPGGTVAGSGDLAADIAAVAKRKPVWAYIEDLGASAAYRLASQAGKIYANAGALVGAIGTFSVLFDLSGQAEQLGLVVHVIRAGEFKGAGTPGTAIEEKHLAEAQRIVDGLNAQFLADVQRGRRLSEKRVAELADGRVHRADEAESLRLIDGVRTIDQVLAELRAESQQKPNSKTPTRRSSMSQEFAELQSTLKSTSEPASYEELERCCPGASADFILSQLKAKSTPEQAQANYTRQLRAENEELKAAQAKQTAEREQAEKERAEKAEAESQQRQRAKPGVGGLKATARQRTETASETGDAVADFKAAVQQRIQGGMSRAQAVRAVCGADPELHQAYLMATNPGSKQQALIQERFELV